MGGERLRPTDQTVNRTPQRTDAPPFDEALGSSRPHRRALASHTHAFEPLSSAVAPAPLAIMIAVPEIPIAISIPMVIVIAPTGVAGPIPGEVAATFITRGDPPGVGVHGAGPVTGMPLVVVSRRIPVALHPVKLRTGSRRKNPDNTRGRRRADLDSDRNLREGRCSGKNKYREQ